MWILNHRQIRTLQKTVLEAASTFEQTLGVLLVQSQQLSGSFANLGKGELDPPHLTLVPQSILALRYNYKEVWYFSVTASNVHIHVSEKMYKFKTYQWVSTPGRDGTSRRDDGGWHMSCDKPNSWQRAWRLRCACNIVDKKSISINWDCKGQLHKLYIFYIPRSLVQQLQRSNQYGKHLRAIYDNSVLR